MSADIIAIGPYSDAVADHLYYDAKTYRQQRTKTGSIVVVQLFLDFHGSARGGEFAAALGISPAWDFNQHVIDRANIDYTKLAQVFNHEGFDDDYADDIESLKVLAENGFDLYFRPNG